MSARVGDIVSQKMRLPISFLIVASLFGLGLVGQPVRATTGAQGYEDLTPEEMKTRMNEFFKHAGAQPAHR